MVVGEVGAMSWVCSELLRDHAKEKGSGEAVVVVANQSGESWADVVPKQVVGNDDRRCVTFWTDQW